MKTPADCPKLILIEDDPDIRSTLQECLELEGYGVEAYANGKTALARLLQKPEPCLILLDLMMPIMDGAEFMSEFAKLPATIVPIPVYLCSALANPETSKKLGCMGFLKKPVDLEILLLLVKGFCKPHERAA